MNFLEICGILFWILIAVAAVFWGSIIIGAVSEDKMNKTIVNDQLLKLQDSE